MEKQKKYNKQIQSIMLDMLKDIDAICKENNITYYLAYGSCLGAVRHGGFIPWDDDADIMLKYDDYERFLCICKEKLDKKKYFVQTIQDDPGYYWQVAKIRNIQTTLVEEGNKNESMENGVFIDVFPLVGYPDGKIKQGIFKVNRAFALSAYRNVINNTFLHAIFKVICFLVGRKRIALVCTNYCLKQKCSDYDNLISVFDGDGIEPSIVSKKTLGTPTRVKFEDAFFPIPEKYHDYLSHIYGDYTKIVKNHVHKPYFYDFSRHYSTLEIPKKKKILFIIWSFSYGGGAEKVLANIVNNMNLDAYEISIIEYYHSSKPQIVRNEINILPSFIKENDSKLKKAIFYLLLYFCPSILRKMKISDKYDLEVSFNYMIPTFLLSKKTKTIAWIHGDINDLSIHKIKKAFQKRALKKVNRIVAISKNTYKSIQHVYPEFIEKSEIIYNGFDFNRILTLGNEYKVENKNDLKRLLFVGRFDDNKNPMFALEIAKELKRKKQKFIMSFLGYGILEDKMKKYINEEKLNDYVEIVGFQANPYPYYKNAHAVISCSKSEGLPTVLIESICFGKPFVTTEVGGAEEISDNQQCGLIATDFDDYLNKTMLLLNDDKKYNAFSKHAKEHVKTYELEKSIGIIQNMFEDIMREI